MLVSRGSMSSAMLALIALFLSCAIYGQDEEISEDEEHAEEPQVQTGTLAIKVTGDDEAIWLARVTLLRDGDSIGDKKTDPSGEVRFADVEFGPLVIQIDPSDADSESAWDLEVREFEINKKRHTLVIALDAL